MSYNLKQQHIPPVQVYLNSKFADFSMNPKAKSHGVFVFYEPLIRIPNGYKYLISLNNAEIPNSIYNVNDNNNNIIFGYYLSGTFYPLIIDGISSQGLIQLNPGIYSADEIAILLSNLNFIIQLRAGIDDTLVINTVYDGNFNKFKFTIASCSVPSSYLTGVKLCIKPFNNVPNPIFGFSGQNILFDLVVNNSGYSDYNVDVTGTRAVFFKVLNLHTSGFDSKYKMSGNILARIPMNAEPNYMIYWINNTNYKTIQQTKNLNILEILITDSDHQPIDFNGVDWSCSIQIDVLGQDEEEYRADVNQFNLS